MDKPVVLITGALTGIGRAAAVAFAKQGAEVVVAGRRVGEGLEGVAELLAQRNAEAVDIHFEPVDAAAEHEHRPAFELLFGRKQVDR